MTIPIGTLCWLRHCENVPQDAGILVTVVDYGPEPRNFRCGDGCYCERGVTLGRAENREHQTYCVANWKDLIPIAPPGIRRITTTEFEA